MEKKTFKKKNAFLVYIATVIFEGIFMAPRGGRTMNFVILIPLIIMLTIDLVVFKRKKL